MGAYTSTCWSAVLAVAAPHRRINTAHTARGYPRRDAALVRRRACIARAGTRRTGRALGQRRRRARRTRRDVHVDDERSGARDGRGRTHRRLRHLAAHADACTHVRSCAARLARAADRVPLSRDRAQRTVGRAGNRHVHDARVPRVDGRRGGRQHPARRRAAVLPAHGVRPVRLGVRAEPGRRRQPLHGQRLQHAVGAARLASGARGVGDSRGLQGRRGRARHDRLVPPRRSRPVRAAGGPALPSAVAADEARHVPHAQRARLQRLGGHPGGPGRLSEVHRPRGHDRVRPLPAAGLVPARRVPRRLRGAARARRARRSACDVPVDRGGADGVLQRPARPRPDSAHDSCRDVARDRGRRARDRLLPRPLAAPRRAGDHAAEHRDLRARPRAARAARFRRPHRQARCASVRAASTARRT